MRSLPLLNIEKAEEHYKCKICLLIQYPCFITITFFFPVFVQILKSVLFFPSNSFEILSISQTSAIVVFYFIWSLDISKSE